MKLCSDSQCRRKGELLPLSEFSINRKKKDGLSIYCRQCMSRRASAWWREFKSKRDAHKPVTIDLVMEAVRNGYRTRDAIQRRTNLDEDSISDALALLYLNSKKLVMKRVDDEAVFSVAA